MILTEIEIIYKKKKSALEIKKIVNSKDAANVFREIWDKSDIEMIERAYILFLDRRNSIIGYKLLAVGGQHGVVMDPKVIAYLAISVMAASVVIAHNHPTGVTSPSNDDIKVSKSVKDTLKVIDVVLVDHIIMTNESYLSLMDEEHI